ncbi:MAG: Fic family protein [Lachnospiraceae bacterium]|nr:Fic family protein [Lachnospiraceae bacterium]
MILEVQAMVEKGASKEKIGLRGLMPPGMLFAVYDEATGAPDYIPPEYSDIPELLEEMVNYVNTTDDHPLIIAAIVHYQLVTIHPFEDGNGRTARLMSGYILDFYGYGFNGDDWCTNKTIINRCAKLANNGFLIPNIVSQRIRSYSLSEFAKRNEKKILSKNGKSV